MNNSGRRKSVVVNVSDNPLDKKKKNVTLEKAMDVFIMSQDSEGHSKETKRDYQWTVKTFLAYIRELHSYVTIDQVSELDILEWLSHLRNINSQRGRPYSTRSIETFSRNLSVFFNWLTNHKYIKSNPMIQIKRAKADKTLIRVFSEDELTLLDSACDRSIKGRALTLDERKALASRDRAFLWLLLSTGIRISEACGLLLSDIDWEVGMIYIRGKGAKERRIPFGKVARQHLDTYIRYWRGESANSDDHVFLNAYGLPLSKKAADTIFVRLKRVSEITDKRVSAHTCRHWFAVNCIKRGMPTIVLKEILGHESWDMIEIYVHLAEQDNKDLYTRFSPVDALPLHHSAKERRGQNRDWRNARKKKG